MQFDRLGPYTIGKRLGRGGMGAVFEGVNVETGESAAVKVLSPHLADDPGFRERFEIEIETLKKLRHPNIVRMLGFGEQDGYLYYAMELVRGRSVEEALQAGQRFTWQEVLRDSINLCKALKHAHDHGVIHRDIKPANLLLTEHGDIKLTDFGIARLFGNQRVTMEGGLIGTAEYMSPEQAGGDRVSPKSDLYSLGSVMFAMLAGRPPFRSASLGEMLHKQRFEPAPEISRLVPDVPRELEECIAQLLSKDPNARPSNALVLSRQLAAMEHGLSVVKERSGEGMTKVGGGNANQTVSDRAADYDPLAPTRVAPSASEAPPLDITMASPSAMGASPSEIVSKTPDRPLTEPPLSSHSASRRSSVPDGDEFKLAEEPGIHSRATIAENRFTTVEEDQHRRELLDRQTDRAPALAQIVVLALCLLSVIGVAVYLLLPPSADQLFARIETAATDSNPEALIDAQGDVDAFLDRYPSDERAPTVEKQRSEIELRRLEKQFNLRARLLGRDDSMLPAERDYLDAMAYQFSDPPRAVAMLQSLVTLYGQPSEDESPRTAQTIELARRQLERLQSHSHQSIASHQAVIAENLRRADKLRDSSPEQSKQIWQSIVTLYGDKLWAADAVKQAKTALENGKLGSN